MLRGCYPLTKTSCFYISYNQIMSFLHIIWIHMELTIQSLGFLIGFQEDIKIPRPHGTINHTVIRVSYRDSKRYQSPPAYGTITIQSLGFLRVSRRYQNHNDNNNHHHHHHHHHNHHRHHHHHRHFDLPGRLLRVRANLRVLP